MSRNNKKKAFTFVEVLIAVAIVAVLFIVILANVDFAPNKANEAGLQQIFRSYQNACQSVGLQYSGFNDTKDELLRHLNQKLDPELQLSLVGDEIVTGATDPWGKIIKIEYSEPVGSKGQLKFISAGPDGVYYNADDIMTQIRYQKGGDIIIENPTNDPYHTHSYTLEVAEPQFVYKAATCQSKAVYYKSCECGDAGTDTFEYGEFDFTNHENTTTSYTYVNDEKHNLVKKCTLCSRQASATEQPHQDNGTGLCIYCGGTTHEHEFVIQSQAATAKKNDANCQSPLTYYLSCECGLHSNSLTFSIGEKNLSKHTGEKIMAGLQNAHTKYDCCGAIAGTIHDYIKSEVTPATCTQPGTDRYSCACGYSYTDSSPVKGHDSNGMVATNTYLKSAATCSTAAIYYKSCSRCGAKGTQTFVNGSKDMNNHVGTTSQSYADYNETYHRVVVKCSGCNTNVSTTEEAHTLSGSNCSKCGRHIHNYNKEVVDNKFAKTAATCVSGGIYYKSCSCGQSSAGTPSQATFTTDKNASNHAGAGCELVPANRDNACIIYSRCGVVADASHSMQFVGTAAVHSKCADCGYTSATHTYDKETVNNKFLKEAANCTTGATYYRSCACGFFLSSNATFTNGTKDTSRHASGCNVVAAGTASVCMKYSLCGVAADTTHAMSNTGTAAVHQTCIDCNYKTTTHSYTAATCTTASACSCGYSNGPALGHSPATTATWDTNHTRATVKCTRSGCTMSWSGESTKSTTTIGTCTTAEQYKHSATFKVNGTSKTFTCTGHTGSKNSANHSGTVVNGGTQAVHTKYSCCGVTVSSTHSMSAATCTAGAKCSCGYTTGSGLGHDPQSSVSWNTNHTKGMVSCGRSGCTQTWSANTSEVTTTEATCMQVRIYKHKVTINVNGTNKTFECSGGHTGSKNASNHSGAGCTVVNAATASVCKKWSKCGATHTAAHTMTAATCTTKATCSVCGYQTGNVLGHSPATTCTWDTNHTKATVKCTRTGCSQTWSSTSVSETTTTTATCMQVRVYKHTTTFSVNGTNKTFECSGGHTGSKNASNHSGAGCTVVNAATASVCQKWSKCGASYDTTHNMAAATCTAQSTCTTCGYKTGSALGHSPATTCTWDTNHTKATVKCTRSGCSQTWSSTSVSEVTTTTATCTVKRVYKHTTTFSVNGTNKTFECSGGHVGTVNASNHTGSVVFGGTQTVHTKYNCCNATASSTHSYANATCTAPATCACGYTTGTSLGHSPATSATWDTNHTKATVACTRSGCTQTWSSTSVSESTTTTATCMQVRVYKHTTTFSVNGTSKTFECSGGHTGSKNVSNHSGAGCTVVNAATASVCQKWSKCGATYVAAHTPNADDGNCTTAIKCKTCGYITTAAKSHAFTNDADTSCNNSGCTYTRSVTANYKVNHYQMNTSGTYPSTPFATETLSGTNNTTLTLANLKKTYTGFTYSYGQVGGSTVTTTTILADGTRVINLYYTRNKYTVTLSKGTGVASVSGAGTYYYGASVTINATMSAGYNWYKWTGTHSTTTQSYTFTMPASNVSDTANSTAGTFYITYDANGGTGAPATQSFTFNAGQAISTTRPTRACYTFSHWLSNPNSRSFAPGETIPGGWGSFTLIAQWTFVGHTYSNNCDTSCNGCGATRTITHTYSYTCDTTCNVCGATRSASHSYPADDGNCTTAIKCSYGCGTVGTAAKSHNYSTIVTNATCTATGTKKCSNTGCTATTSIAALGHDYKTQSAATCTAAEVEKCSRCTSTRTGDAALGHNYQTYTAATCGSAEVEKCSRCSATRTGDAATGNHSYGSYSAYTSYTHRRTCSVCSKAQTASCSFTYRTTDVATSGSCTVAPTYYYECSTCTNRDGSTYTGTAPGHNYLTYIAADCNDPETEECSRCGAQRTGDAALGHNYQTYTAATCTSAEVEKCSRCSATRTGDAATGHSYGSYRAYTSTTHRRTCNNCGVGQSASCSFTYKSGDLASSATCTAAARYYYECSICTNQSGTYTSGSALGHNYVETVAPTCTTSGKKVCNRSGCSSTVTLAATGHDSEYGGVASQHTYCVNCGITLSSTHSYSITKTATCKSSGTKTCSCGYSMSYSDSTNHTGPITTTDSSTCTTAGTITQKCSGCGRTTGTLMGDALGHNYTSSGKCSRCGAACSHSYGSTSYVQAAGNKHRATKTCTKCNYSSTTLQGCIGSLLVDNTTAMCMCGREVARIN